jgi:hypothetical protein
MANNSITLNIRLKWLDIPNDFVVWYDNLEIGRIRLAADLLQTAWEWSIVLPMLLPEWARGARDVINPAHRDIGTA